ncbi:hypothetical protein [Sphingopyxis panaciterrulae]|uniref:Uncharacterized protein n=1 Tax=Sphingopyxis panaciterrulae TaxID=462372 RepID=A0A7W9B547_9SPHN|nr:hypothetical protein [Sphingopyxis panaciterrulae]MBB5706398.1 hypothetical protein [Sphingopyxis panaciterrulae]
MATAPGEWDRPRDEWLSAATDAMRRGVRGADGHDEWSTGATNGAGLKRKPAR